METFYRVARARERPHTRRSSGLTRGDDFVEPRLEVLLALGPQPRLFHRKIGFNPTHPVLKPANIFAGLALIYFEIFRPGHCFEAARFLGALGRRFRAGPQAKQSGVAGEQMLEAEIHLEMAVLAPKSRVEFLASAEDLQQLRLDCRFSVGWVENREVPGARDFVR